jgi:hypothetical protein
VRQERSRPLIVELELTHNTKDNFIPGQFHTSQTKTISYQDNFIPIIRFNASWRAPDISCEHERSVDESGGA